MTITQLAGVFFFTDSEVYKSGTRKGKNDGDRLLKRSP